MAQDAVAPTLARPLGGIANPAGSAGGVTGLSNPGTTLPPGLTGAGTAQNPVSGVAPSAGRSASSGSTVRRGLRERRPRRNRLPTNGLPGASFRSTLVPADVVANVQPAQTGLPDVADPAGPARRRPAVADDPYAPLGIRLGGLNLFPLIGQSIGYDSNPNRSGVRPRGSFVSQSEAELRVQSDWSRHELTGALRGAWNEYPGEPEASRPEGAGRIGFRYDVSRETQLDTEAHYQIDTQRPDSPDLNARVRERPVFATAGGSAGVTQRFNRIILALRGTIDRTDYEDARLTSGTLLDQGDRNVTQYGGRARLGYELHPGFLPFLEVLGDTRVYDRRIDRSGYARSSDGVGATLGTTFELTRLLTGEVSAGVINRTYEDRRLGNLTSPLASAALVYALTPLTTIRASAGAGVDETTVAGANGVRTIRGALEVAHDIRRNVTLSAGIGVADFDYQGAPIHERTLTGTLRADWRLNRQVTVRASYTHERLDSSIAGSDYATNIVLLGLRLQP